MWYCSIFYLYILQILICFVSVHRKFTTGAWVQLTALERTCRPTYYRLWVRLMPRCTCARKIFAQLWVTVHDGVVFRNMVIRVTMTATVHLCQHTWLHSQKRNAAGKWICPVYAESSLFLAFGCHELFFA